jgi:hypothetical protein
MSTTTQMDPMALLAAMAQQTEKKGGRDANPQVHEPAMDAAISQWIEADKEAKKWDGIRTTAEAQILAFATRARLAECRRMGKVESTVRINGKISMTQKCQYCAVGMQQLPAIKEAFGADADRYFKPRTKLELTEAAAEDKELLGKLIKALGPKVFARSFTVKQFAEVTETFHNDFTLKAEVEAKAGPFLEREALKAYKPSLRQ